ncbi:MAG: multidrug efflux RND transporter permease subunit [Cyclobacteriaceae bacterium]|nr:multidrug efflux RND transporter permease subunit [Cyclobacteriaceae bacterium]
MSEFFIRRPIVAMVISIIIVLVGFISMRSLPIAQYPDITPPEVQVTTSFQGANAINVERAVATPIEQKVNGVENMIYMKSINAADGSLTLRVSFEVGVDLDNSNMLTLNRVNQAEAILPTEVKNMGVVTKKALAFPLLLVGLQSPNGTFDNYFLSNYANINVVDVISRIQGVGDVKLFGGSDYAMRIWVKPDQLAKLGLTMPDLIKAVRAQNTISPAGKFGGNPAPEGTQMTYTVLLKDRLVTEKEFGDIIVRTNASGSQVRLKDVARLQLGTENYNSEGRINRKPGATIAIFQVPGSNALDVAEKVKQTMMELSGRFPDDLSYAITLDTTLAVDAGIEEIIHTLFEAIVLVILVVFIFLQDWRATLIPLLTVPVSLVGTFMVFPLLGFSINVLSLLGLVLAIGIVVDDAIVVVEAVMHHIEQGKTPREATVQAMKEVSGPVVAIALILCAVFVPVAGMGGITGSLYQQFAITIAISVAFSAFSALTLSPALSAMLLRPHQKSKGILGKFFDGFNRVFDKFTNGYVGVTQLFVKKTIRTVILLAVLITTIVLLGRRIPAGFVPEEDQGYFLVNVTLPDAASLERTRSTMNTIENILAEEESIETVTGISGFSLLINAYSPNFGFFFVSMKEWGERPDAKVSDVLKKVNRRLMREIPEANAMAFGPPPIQGLGNAAGFTMMVQDRGGNTPQYLADHTMRFIQAASQRPEIGRIYTTYRTNVPQVYLDLDRDKVLKLGLTLEDVNQTIGAALGASYVNDFNRFGRQYKVFLQAEGNYRVDPQDLNKIFVRTPNGDMVPLSTLITVTRTTGPEFTNRFNLYRAAELGGAPAPGFSSDQALTALEEVATTTLPKDMGYEWAYMSYQEKKAAGTGSVVFLLAMLFVFLILAAQYESWSLPFSVLLGTPFAVFGAFLGLWLAGFFLVGYENNVFAQIGLVMLIGLAAKNAILIVEFAKEGVEKGKTAYDAAMEAARLRLRPILMTAFAFILGVVPLVRAVGAGAEGRKVMGMTVFSGMLIATILGVLLVPSLFVMIEKLAKRKAAEGPKA